MLPHGYEYGKTIQEEKSQKIIYFLLYILLSICIEENICSFIIILFVIELLIELIMLLPYSILASIIIGILIFRLYLGHQAKKLSEDLALSTDIPAETDNAYKGKFINESDKRGILSPYEEDYQSASKLSAWLERFHVNATDEIINLISSYESFDSIVERHNRQVEDEILKKNKTFFDTCLKYPLDQQQRKAIIADEDNVLVVSSGLHYQDKSIKYISNKMGNSQTSIIMRLGKLGVE